MKISPKPILMVLILTLALLSLTQGLLTRKMLNKRKAKSSPSDAPTF